MKILVIGGGGREHALVWKLAETPGVDRLVASPGNPGIEEQALCRTAATPEEFLQVAEAEGVDLTVVGPEAPLVAGVVDLFRARQLPIVGPTAKAARLEGSKSFSKDLMLRAGVPTARYEVVQSADAAHDVLAGFRRPVVLKADGLAAGKGVVIARTTSEVEAGVETLCAGAGTLVIEEFLEGEEVSFIVLTDGERAVLFPPSQDHKTVLDGDTGPNTGGMGAYSDDSILGSPQTGQLMEQVIFPTLRQMKQEGTPFTGFLYAGLMMTPEGPKVLEFNARMGDPETQVLLHRLDDDFASILHSAAVGELRDGAFRTKPEPSVCVVLAAHGYPGKVRTGDPIHGIHDAEAEGAKVFQAGTRLDEGRLCTAGGRVLGVTASGPSLPDAIRSAYEAAGRIHFDGMHYRRDIGAKGLTRLSR